MTYDRRVIGRFAAPVCLAVGLSACESGGVWHAAEYDFSAARDTIALEQTDRIVVAALTDLVEWRGDLVVADRLERNLKIYDLESGALKHVIGRPGQGPGEFVSVLGAAVLSDGRLAVLDGMLSRVTVFDDPGTVERIHSLPGNFGTGIDALPDGGFLLAGHLVADRRIISDSAVHQFNSAGNRVAAYFTLPEPTHFAEGSMNSMTAVAVDSTILGLQATTNVVVSYNLRDGTEGQDSLGQSFYTSPRWTLEPGNAPADAREWLKEQMMAWWLRTLDSDTYVAGFQVWVDSIQDWRQRWVFGRPKSGPFAETRLTDAHPAFIRDNQLYSVRIAPDGAAELIVGPAPSGHANRR